MKKNIEDDFSMMEAGQIEKLKEIVAQTLKEEVLIMDRLAHPTKEKLNKGQSISDKVAKFGGSWKFIILFAFILLFWILFNEKFENALNKNCPGFALDFSDIFNDLLK